MLSPFLARSVERAARPLWHISEQVHRFQCGFMQRLIMPSLINRAPPSYPDGPVSVICLVSHQTWLMGAWMARSAGAKPGHFSRR